MTVYDALLQETKFTMDQLRSIERRIIAAAKMEGKPAPGEEYYRKKVMRVKAKMEVCGLLFETVIEIYWPSYIGDGGFTQRSTGPGFYATQREYQGGYNE